METALWYALLPWEKPALVVILENCPPSEARVRSKTDSLHHWNRQPALLWTTGCSKLQQKIQIEPSGNLPVKRKRKDDDMQVFKQVCGARKGFGFVCMCQFLALVAGFLNQSEWPTEGITHDYLNSTPLQPIYKCWVPCLSSVGDMDTHATLGPTDQPAQHSW